MINFLKNTNFQSTHMSQENPNVGLIVASAVIGLAAIVSVNLLKGPISNKNQFEFKQEGPVFLRFNKYNGDLCYTGIGPNGKFVTDAWLCLEGDKTRAGETLQMSDRQITEQAPQQSSSKAQSSKAPAKTSSKSTSKEKNKK